MLMLSPGWLGDGGKGQVRTHWLLLKKQLPDIFIPFRIQALAFKQLLWDPGKDRLLNLISFRVP